MDELTRRVSGILAAGAWLVTVAMFFLAWIFAIAIILKVVIKVAGVS